MISWRLALKAPCPSLYGGKVIMIVQERRERPLVCPQRRVELQCRELSVPDLVDEIYQLWSESCRRWCINNFVTILGGF